MRDEVDMKLRAPLFLTSLVMAISAFGQSYHTSYENGQMSGLPVITAPMSQEEAMGQAIWYMAAPNSRYHTYTFPTRVGSRMDFWSMFRADRKFDDPQGQFLGRYSLYGSINDPDCCAPGKDCQERAKIDSRFAGKENITLDQTYGLDYCLGDDGPGGIWDAVRLGEEGYKKQYGRSFKEMDPACQAPFNECHLDFGFPTGVVGFRKFPNPRFDAKKWAELNGGMDNWNGWQKQIADQSLEPPYRIGLACAGCHVSHNPINPADNPSLPQWDNLRGAFGAQYTRTSEQHSSGLPENDILKQVFRTRPGMTDTSAVPHDLVYNPGTMLSVLNIDVKPMFEEVVRGELTKIHRILKGGEDSTGALDAVHRVYINIGTCAEQCWVNHLTDLSVADSKGRNFLQTPFNPNQCRKDCKNFGALERNLGHIVSYLLTRRPTDLKDAIPEVKGKVRTLERYIENELALDGKKLFEKGDIDKGRKIFAGLGEAGKKARCATCHSTQLKEGMDPKDLFAKTNRPFIDRFGKGETVNGNPAPEGVRRDWLGNDKLTPASEVGTNRCRSLHSNHMKGHVWEYYSSDTYKERASQTAALGDEADGGRGYYRNISLLSVWATAPFLHNNSIGPEICGSHSEYDYYRFAYNVNEEGLVPNLSGTATASPESLQCQLYDHTVEGRLKLYMASMDSLLNPGQRWAKTARTQKPIRLEVGPRVWVGKARQVGAWLDTLLGIGTGGFFKQKLGDILGAKLVNLKVEIPQGTPASLIASLDAKALFTDFKTYLATGELPKEKAHLKETFDFLMSSMRQAILTNPESVIKITGKHKKLLGDLLFAYNTCTDLVENKGHEFGGELAPEEKRALKAFLLTL
jgi:hypothetical protein